MKKFTGDHFQGVDGVDYFLEERQRKVFVGKPR